MNRKKYISMKRTIFSIIGLAMTIGSMAQSFTEGDFSYEPLTDGTVAVAACTLQQGIASVPQTVSHDGQTYTVAAVGESSFAGCRLAAIYLPESVTAIGQKAFQGCTATFIRIPSGLKTIGQEAFSGCAAIGHIDLPQTLETLSAAALAGTGIYTIGTDELPNLTEVGDNALAGCSQLPYFPLTDKVTSLGSGVFSGCAALQSVYLPSTTTEIADNMFAGCRTLKSVTMSPLIQRIGIRAFQNSGLTGIDLSQFKGEIGAMAFNGCRELPLIPLPTNERYIRRYSGKTLFERETGNPVTILPTIDTLVITYPATGISTIYLDTIWREDGTYAIVGQEICALNDTFAELKSLELPYTWQAGLTNGSYESLEDLTVRTPAPFAVSSSLGQNYRYLENGEKESLLTVRVFPYARNAFQSASRYDSNMMAWSQNSLKYADIDLPTEKLYIDEALPLFEGSMKSRLANMGVVWTADWNTELTEKFPDYFTSELNGTFQFYGYNASPTDYRSYLVSQYMTNDKFGAYAWQADSIVRCLDGPIRISSAFDVNDYVNWYLRADTLSPDLLLNSVQNRTTQITPVDADTPYWYIASTSSYGTPRLDYALRMVPDIYYSIYLLMAPHIPEKAMINGEETDEEPKNRIKATFTYNAAAENGSTTTMTSDADFSYSGEVQSVLLFDSVTVARDYFNSIAITTRTTAAERRQGYSNNFAIVGIVAVPQKDIEILPSGVEEPTEDAMAPEVLRYYDLSGRRRSQPVRGVNILQMSDGTTRRIMAK